MTEPRVRRPLPRGTAWREVAGCVVTGMRVLARGELRQPREHLGRLLDFADGTAARVYRETVAERRTASQPCFLAVRFRLRHVRGRAHALFRMESILNTPLFVGFPGFVSKLWLAHDDRGMYRGLYEWDGADRAERYARSLWRVLEMVSEPDSIDYQVVPGVRRDEALNNPGMLADSGSDDAWWRVTRTRAEVRRPAQP